MTKQEFIPLEAKPHISIKPSHKDGRTWTWQLYSLIQNISFTFNVFIHFYRKFKLKKNVTEKKRYLN